MTKSTKVLAIAGLVAGVGAVAALPAAGHASESATTDITATINETLSITATSAVSGTLTNGGAVTELKDTGSASGNVNVKTNHQNGYTLSAKGTGTADNKTSLINANSATIAYGNPAVNASAWGMFVNTSETPFALTAADQEIDRQSTPTTTDGRNTATVYKASAASNQAAGTYTGQVTFTAAVL